MLNPNSTAGLIAIVFASARYSIERSVRPISETSELENAADIVGKLERLRFPMQAISRRSLGRFGPDDFIRNLDLAGHGLSSLISDEDFRLKVRGIPFRLEAPTRRYFDQDIADKYPALFSSDKSVLDTLKYLLDFMGEVRQDDYIRKMFEPEQVELPMEAREINSQATINALKKIVPQQKIAPVQFKISNERILIDRKPSEAESADEGNIDKAKQKIIDDGNEIIDKLKKSNCDKRLIENIEALHESIRSDENSIRIGVNNISFGIISAVFKDELPEAINAALQSHNLSVNMYVAQFPDWVRFSENALAAEITPEDTIAVKNGVNKVIDYLDQNPEIAEPGVARAFKNLNRTLENPTQSSKKSTFAVIRTAENLFSKIFQYAIGYFEKLASDTAKEVHKNVVKGLSITIVTLAVTGAAEISGISLVLKSFHGSKTPLR